jgi:hypothetical protein
VGPAGDWQPYQRAARRDTLLTAHADYRRTRAPQVEYSARILYQERRQQRGYTGSYETVKAPPRFRRPQDSARGLDRRLRHYGTRTTLLVIDEIGYLSYGALLGYGQRPTSSSRGG